MIDLARLSGLVETYGHLVRILIVDHQGSAPRNRGTDMWVGAAMTEGTIGGGRLEFDAIATARDMLLKEHGDTKLQRIPLGPGLGQCCGGRVSLLFERWNAKQLAGLNADAKVFSRRIEGEAKEPAGLHATETPVSFKDGWLAEPLSALHRNVVIHGAGHVGSALAQTLAGCEAFNVTVLDDRQEWAEDLPKGVTALCGNLTNRSLPQPSDQAAHLVMTHDHALDLEICHRLLQTGFGFAGLIGSATKWARFRSRLRALGHVDAEIDRITCPIGDPTLGKHPRAIAIGVAAQLLSWRHEGGK